MINRPASTGPEQAELDIAIIGAGFSGTLVACHLLRQSHRPVRVGLFERDPAQFGRGVAYSSPMNGHLLNVPAGGMSAFPDEPDHFLRWALARQHDLIDLPGSDQVTADSFLPRRVYGDYLTVLLDQAEASARRCHTLKRCPGKVVAIRLTGTGGACLEQADGSCYTARQVVLAIGNFPPANPPPREAGFYQSPRYHRNPWLPGVLSRLLKTGSCLLAGGGLTMVDWVVTLRQAGYGGRIHLISRRGLWPQAHQKTSPSGFTLRPDTLSVRDALHQIRQHLRETGEDWHAVIDNLRPCTPSLWQRWSVDEKKRFLKHLRPYWDLHRHRLPPRIAWQLDSMKHTGQLIRHCGRILAYRENLDGVEVCYRPRFGHETERLWVESLVNCSGAESDYRRLESHLVKSLLQQGLIQPDALTLGLQATADGALLQANGKPSTVLYTLGPPLKGMLWETTAVPELRVQAQHLARHLLERLPVLRAERA